MADLAQPPKYKITYKFENKIKLEYSAKKKNAKRNPEYSVL